MAKFTSKIALELVERIEALENQIRAVNDQIYAVYREANDYGDPINANAIREIVAARAAAADQKAIADGVLESLDREDDD